MSAHSMTISLLVGNGVPTSDVDGVVSGAAQRARVDIAPAYAFQRADGGTNWPVVRSFVTDTGTVVIPGLEDSDSTAALVTWQMRVSFLDRGNKVVGAGAAVLFQIAADAAADITYPDDVTLVDVVLPPEYGPTWAEQAKASEIAAEAAKTAAEAAQTLAEQAAADAAAVGASSDAQVAANVNTGPLTGTALGSKFVPQAGGVNIGGPFTSMGNTVTGEGFIIKTASLNPQQGVFGWQHASDYGYIIHFESRSGGAAPGAFIGMGLDFAGPDLGAGPTQGVGGLLISNKSYAIGINIGQQTTISNAKAYGIWGRQRSIAPFFYAQTANGAVVGDVVAPLIVLAVEGGVTPNVATNLQEWRSPGNTLGGYVDALTANLQWITPVNFRDTKVRTTLSLLNDTGAGNPAMITMTATGSNRAIFEAQNNVANSSDFELRMYRSTGGGTYWESEIKASGNDLMLRSAPAAAKGSEVPVTVLAIRNGNAIGFYNVTPVTRPNAYTQTYATATRTHAARTAPTAPASVVTTASTTGAYGYTQAQADAIVTAVNLLITAYAALRTDDLNSQSVLNSLIDDLQLNGLLQ